MQNDKSTCNVTVYLYNEKLRFYELILCLLLLFIVLSFSRFTFYATHIYLAWSTLIQFKPYSFNLQIEEKKNPNI